MRGCRQHTSHLSFMEKLTFWFIKKNDFLNFFFYRLNILSFLAFLILTIYKIKHKYALNFQKPEGSFHLPNFDLQETEKKKKYNFIEPTENVYNEADQVEETDSQHIYDISKHQSCNKKQNYNKKVMYSHLHGNPLHMCENEYDFQRPMLDSSSTYDAHIF